MFKQAIKTQLLEVIRFLRMKDLSEELMILHKIVLYDEGSPNEYPAAVVAERCLM